MKHSQGFSLIEVLLTIALVSSSLLGMLKLQSISIQYTQAAVQRNAAMNLAYELVEIMRAHRHELLRRSTTPSEAVSLLASTVVYQANGRLKVSGAGCAAQTLAQSLSEQLGCWFEKVKTYLPGASELRDFFVVCPSYKLDADARPVCADSSYRGVNLGIQLAWRSQNSLCGESDMCIYTTQVAL